MARVRPLVLPEGSLVEGPSVLPDDVARYVRDVLRLRAGAEVWVTDGAGHTADGTVTAVERRRVEVTLRALRTVERPPRPDVTLIQGVGKGDKLETVVRQAVELGVRRMVPVLTERAVARREAKDDRLRAVAEDAMRVSGRSWRPVIAPVRPLAEVFAAARAGPAFALVLGAEWSLTHRLNALRSPTAIELLVGPEGGLSPAEASAAQSAGFEHAHLGPHTLRTETAGPAVVALAVALCGAWDREA